MKKIEAFIRPEKLNMTQDAIEEQGCECITVSAARGHGHLEDGSVVFERRKYGMDLLPEIRVEIIIADKDLDKVVQAIISASQTGSVGDGKIFVSDVRNAYRIRTGEHGGIAI